MHPFIIALAAAMSDAEMMRNPEQLEAEAQRRLKENERPENCPCSICERTRERFAEQDGNVRPNEPEPAEPTEQPAPPPEPSRTYGTYSISGNAPEPEPEHTQVYPLWSLVRLRDQTHGSMGMIVGFNKEMGRYMVGLLNGSACASCSPDDITLLTSSTAEMVVAMAKQYDTAA